MGSVLRVMNPTHAGTRLRRCRMSTRCRISKLLSRGRHMMLLRFFFPIGIVMCRLPSCSSLGVSRPPPETTIEWWPPRARYAAISKVPRSTPPLSKSGSIWTMLSGLRLLMVTPTPYILLNLKTRVVQNRSPFFLTPLRVQPGVTTPASAGPR